MKKLLISLVVLTAFIAFAFPAFAAPETSFPISPVSGEITVDGKLTHESEWELPEIGRAHV